MKLRTLFSRGKSAVNETVVPDENPERDRIFEYIPTKSRALRTLIDIGTPVDAIIDVGVQFNTQQLIDYFGDKPHVLCEPIAEYHEAITHHYTFSGVAFDIEASAMSNMDGTVELELSSVIDGLDVSHARMASGENSAAGLTRRTVVSKRVDTMVQERNLSGPFLLKIDVDGAEPLVLEGAKDTLPKCSAVIIEAETRNLFERAAPIMAAGFQLFEIVDFCYYDKRLSQVDLVFANPRFFEPNGLQVVRDQFDFAKWVELAPPSG